MIEAGTAARLRAALLAAEFTGEAVLALLGPSAAAALGRAETVPARRVTAGGSPLETLVRLFLLQLAVPRDQALRALPLDDALAAGLLAVDGDEVRAALDLQPYDSDDMPSAGTFVVSDLPTGLDGITRPLAPDHVLGVGGASTTLAQLTVRPPVERALDIGTGSGVQALHLAQHAGTVTATDVLPRAIALAALTAALSGARLDLRTGSLLEPVRGEQFDLVVSNPPFVVGPGGDARFAYRDSGLAGDEVSRRLVAEAPGLLAPDGWCQLLANWVHRAGEDWRDRVGGWLPRDVDAWVVQRETQDPAEYVSLWLRDSGDSGGADYVGRYDAWLSAFDRAGIEGVGFGYVSMRRRADGAPGVHRVEDWPHAVEQPLGPVVEQVLLRARRLGAMDDDGLAALRLTVAPDVVQETSGEPGAEDPRVIVLRQQGGMRRAQPVDTATAALVGACDGELPVGALVAAVADVLDRDAQEVRAQVVPVLRRLVADGLLTA